VLFLKQEAFYNMQEETNRQGGELRITNADKTKLSREQKVFNQLIQQIAQLQQELKDTSVLLDKQLQYFIKHLFPLMQQVVVLRTKMVVLLNGFMTISKGLSVQEKESLRLLIINQLHEIFRHQQEDPEGELLDIFNAVSDITYQDLTAQYLDKLKAAVNKHQDAGDTGDGYPVKHGGQENTTSYQRKTKKQLRHEERERILEEARRKDVQHLYRQLAKVFHPDLEQDPARISQKEELMKQLTIAREQGDLMTMLQLELSWIQQEDRHPDQLTNETLKLYNITLQEQVKDLQAQIQTLFLHPRYECLQGMAKSPQSLRFIDWKTEKRNLEHLQQGLQQIIAGLPQDTRQAVKVLRAVVKWNG
jgi:hypothetical protein